MRLPDKHPSELFRHIPRYYLWNQLKVSLAEKQHLRKQDADKGVVALREHRFRSLRAWYNGRRTRRSHPPIPRQIYIGVATLQRAELRYVPTTLQRAKLRYMPATLLVVGGWFVERKKLE